VDIPAKAITAMTRVIVATLLKLGNIFEFELLVLLFEDVCHEVPESSTCSIGYCLITVSHYIYAKYLRKL
jgi:hypothetical protein